MRLDVLVALSLAVVSLAQGTSSNAASGTIFAVPSSVPSPDSCILGCITPPATKYCGSLTNLTCVCTNPTFLTAASTCIVALCTDAEREIASELQQAECASLGSATDSTTGTTPQKSAEATNTIPFTGTSSVPIPKPTSGSAMSPVDIDRAVALVGALIGGAGVL